MQWFHVLLCDDYGYDNDGVILCLCFLFVFTVNYLQVALENMNRVFNGQTRLP